MKTFLTAEINNILNHIMEYLCNLYINNINNINNQTLMILFLLMKNKKTFYKLELFAFIYLKRNKKKIKAYDFFFVFLSFVLGYPSFSVFRVVLKENIFKRKLP